VALRWCSLASVVLDAFPRLVVAVLCVLMLFSIVVWVADDVAVDVDARPPVAEVFVARRVSVTVLNTVTVFVVITVLTLDVFDEWVDPSTPVRTPLTDLRMLLRGDEPMASGTSVAASISATTIATMWAIEGTHIPRSLRYRGL